MWAFGGVRVAERGACIHAIASHSQLKSQHTRTSGRNVFIQFHLEIPGDLSLRHAHDVADTVELAIATEFPDAEILIHQDPAGHEDVPEAMHPESPLAPTPPTA